MPNHPVNSHPPLGRGAGNEKGEWQAIPPQLIRRRRVR